MTSEYNGHKQTKRQKLETSDDLREIHEFCEANGIKHSATMDSYYFRLYGKYYRVSNHTVERSNKNAYSWDGKPLRKEYHPKGRDKDTIYIHAGKTRIFQIYNDLKAGKMLNGHGYPVDGERPKKSKKANKTPMLRSGLGAEWDPLEASRTYDWGKPKRIEEIEDNLVQKKHTLSSGNGKKWDPILAYKQLQKK